MLSLHVDPEDGGEQAETHLATETVMTEFLRHTVKNQ